MKNNIEEYLKLAKAKGQTTTEIILSSGIGRTSFYDIMSGKQVPKLDTAISISQALQASPADIFPQLKEMLKNDQVC